MRRKAGRRFCGRHYVMGGPPGTGCSRDEYSSLRGRRLRVTDTVSLGEKRFVSIVEVDGARFLIGGAVGSVSLLAALGAGGERQA